MFAYLERKALEYGVAFNSVLVLYGKCSPFTPVELIDEKPYKFCLCCRFLWSKSQGFCRGLIVKM